MPIVPFSIITLSVVAPPIEAPAVVAFFVVAFSVVAVAIYPVLIETEAIVAITISPFPVEALTVKAFPVISVLICCEHLNHLVFLILAPLIYLYRVSCDNPDAHQKKRKAFVFEPNALNISGAPGPIRTVDTSFRRAVLCPLSYGGVGGIVPNRLAGCLRRSRA